MPLENVHLDLTALANFASGSLPVPSGQKQPVDQVLTQAWQAMLDAGVLVDSNGQPPSAEYATISVSVEEGIVTIGPDISPSAWSGKGLPPLDGIVYALAFALVAIVTGTPNKRPHPWPHT